MFSTLKNVPDKFTGINKLGFFVHLVYLKDYEHKKSKLKCHAFTL
jgi:hypothetical protein